MRRMVLPLFAGTTLWIGTSVSAQSTVGYDPRFYRPVAPQRQSGPPCGHIGTPPCPLDPRDSVDAPDGQSVAQLKAYAEQQFRRRDYSGAFRTYERAAAMGDIDAKRQVSVAWTRGIGAPHQDVARGLGMMREIAGVGDARANYHMGFYYEQGRFVPRDYGRALGYFTTSANAGTWQSAFKLGIMSELGEGVAHDRGAAIRWFDRAARLTDDPTPSLYASFLRKSGGRRFASGQQLIDAYWVDYVATHTPRYVPGLRRGGGPALTMTSCGGIYAPSACASSSYRDVYAHRNDAP